MSLLPNFQRCYGGVYMLDGVGPSLRNIERLDAGAAPMIARMMRDGMRVDLDHFKRMETSLSRDMDQITETVRKLTGYYVNLDSGDQVSDLLFRKLGLKQAHPKLTNSGDRESVADQVLTAIQHEHPVVPQIQDFKELSKLRGTYAIPIQELAVKIGPDNWRLFPSINQNRVPSGRLAAKNPNVLAIPSRTRRGREIRKGFIPSKGRVMLSSDLSQIEPRISTHRSMDPGLVSIYEQGEDIYSDFAIAAFKLKDERYYDEKARKWKYPGVDPMRHRRHCKICILAAFYDVTAKGLLEQMPVVCARCMMEATQHTCEHEWEGLEVAECARCGLKEDQTVCNRYKSYWTEELCQDILNSFYLKYVGVLKMRSADHKLVRAKAMLWDIWGRILHVGAVRSVLTWVVSSALREAGNFPIQCLHPDSRVFKQGLGMTRIGDLVGQEATLWDGSEWSTGSVVSSGMKNQLIITLADGFELRCSPDHKIRIAGPKGNLSWVKASDLINRNHKNSRVCLSNSIPKSWSWGQLSNTSRKYSNKVDIEWGNNNPFEFGQMLGRIASDGSVVMSPSGSPKAVYMIVADHEISILPKLIDWSVKTVGHRFSIDSQKMKSDKYAPVYRIGIFSANLAEIFSNWNLKWRIPSIVWSNANLLRGYLRGLFDGDGGVRKTGSGKGGGTVVLTAALRKKDLISDVQQALLLFGIRSRLKTYTYKYGSRVNLCIRQKDLWRFGSTIGFINSKKMSALDEIITFNPDKAVYGKAVSIKSIKAAEPIEMVDFVNSTTGRFSAEGMIVHNSSASGVIKLAMAQIHNEFEAHHVYDSCSILLQIHDELLFDVDRHYASDIAVHIQDRMESVVRLRIPVKAGASTAESWGLLEK